MTQVLGTNDLRIQVMLEESLRIIKENHQQKRRSKMRLLLLSILFSHFSYGDFEENLHFSSEENGSRESIGQPIYGLDGLTTFARRHHIFIRNKYANYYYSAAYDSPEWRETWQTIELLVNDILQVKAIHIRPLPGERLSCDDEDGLNYICFLHYTPVENGRTINALAKKRAVLNHLFSSKSRLEEADIWMFRMEDNLWKPRDFYTIYVITHEILHGFGLAHVPTETIMHPTSSWPDRYDICYTDNRQMMNWWNQINKKGGFYERDSHDPVRFDLDSLRNRQELSEH